MKIKAKTAGISFIVLMIGGLVLSMVTGYWVTESSKEPAKFTEGEFTGTNNPADIRGSYSLDDIHNAFDIPLDSLVSAFALDEEENPASVQVKLFEEIFGIIDGREIGTDSMRYFVALYKGLPFLAEEDTALPKSAISILKKEGAMTDGELAEASENSVSLESIHVMETLSEDHDETALLEIQGKTLFSDLYNWGITNEEIEMILGIPAGGRTESVRDFCLAEGIEFSTVKGPIQEILNSK